MDTGLENQRQVGTPEVQMELIILLVTEEVVLMRRIRANTKHINMYQLYSNVTKIPNIEMTTFFLISN